MTNEANLSLSAYDRSLGIGTPSLYRLFCLRRMPDVDGLVLALRRALERFPRFATRIVLTDDGQSRLAPLEEPLKVEIRPKVEWTAETFRLDHVPSFVRGLTTRSGQPVLAVTLTPVTDGAVLGVSCSHAVGDMYSYYVFHAYWNDQIRSLEEAPDDRNDRLRALVARTRGPVGGVAGGGPLGASGLRRGEEAHYSRWIFDQDELEELRAELTDAEISPSLNEALTAYVFHRFMVGPMRPTQPVRLRIPISLRGTHPLLPADFIGNAIVEALVPVSDFGDHPAAARATAHRIRESVRAARSPRELATRISVEPDGIRYIGGDDYAYDESTDILCTNTAKMKFGAIDFGCGAPATILGLTYNGMRISATENGLEAHVRWDERRARRQQS